MLVGSYSFNDPNDHEDVQKTIQVLPSLLHTTYYNRVIISFSLLIVLLQRIMGADYKIPHNIKISEDCRELLSRIFVRALEGILFYDELIYFSHFLIFDY